MLTGRGVVLADDDPRRPDPERREAVGGGEDVPPRDDRRPAADPPLFGVDEAGHHRELVDGRLRAAHDTHLKPQVEGKGRGIAQYGRHITFKWKFNCVQIVLSTAIYCNAIFIALSLA